MIEPIRISFVVACLPEHAFKTWTGRASAWWPSEATMSHESGVEVIFEPQAGGRIYERTTAGLEFDWGRITEWDPPRRVRYSWHIASERSSATDVEIVFSAVDGSQTRVEIEHGGWERLGEAGPPWREANQGGWDGVLPAYVAACTAEQ